MRKVLCSSYSSVNILPPHYIEGYLWVLKETSSKELQKLIKFDMRKNSPTVALHHHEFDTAPQNLRYLKVTGETFSPCLLHRQKKTMTPAKKSPATIAVQTPPVDAFKIDTKKLGQMTFFPVFISIPGAEAGTETLFDTKKSQTVYPEAHYLNKRPLI